mgnify:CR=1 FL=1
MKKRILSILLTLCMVLCLVPITVFAAGGAKVILPGTSAQSILKIDQSRLSFAGHEWWVIGQKTDKSNNAPIITLLAVNNDFGDVPFRTGSDGPFENARRYSEDNGYYANNPSDMSQWRKPNEYAGSTLQQKMVSLAEAIPEKEQAVIRPKDITEGITGQEVKAQKLWALSQEDSIYLYRNSCKYAAQWWTRSSNEVYGYGSWTIHPDGRSGSALNVDYDAAVRPAMELDLSSVLFISAAEHGKVADLTTPIAEYAGDEWKLTLHDSDRDDFTAKTVLVNGSVLEVEYKNAKVGDNEYISAVIKDADGSISRYTRVVQLDGTTNGTRGRAAIDLTGIDMTGKTLCVFNEQFNGDHKTDYAGALREVKLTDEIDEQFTLTPGGRYYFDLSAMDVPGTANSNLPDSTLHYVPFTYAGTVNAYSLENEADNDTTSYEHSLFIANYNVTHTVSWDALNTAGLLFGKDYAGGGVDYTLRAPSVGSNSTGSGDSQRGVPQSNEWDTMLNKNSGYIKNWNGIYSWGQDTTRYNSSLRAVRGYDSGRRWNDDDATDSLPLVGFRPVLEILNPDTLGSDGLKAVTLNLGGGKLGGSSDAIHIIVKNGSKFTAPASGGLTRPAGDTGSYFMWLDSNGNSYAPGASVPADVTELTVQWTAPTYAVTLNTNGGTINNGNVTGYTYGVGATLPAADDMTYTGHTFKGWYDNENLTGSPVTAIGDTETGNKEYWAKWEINQYTVTVKPENGEADITITQDYGTPITAPTLTREGYQFNGWDKAFPTTMPAENLTITAQWRDIAVPTGEIKIAENDWKSFLNTITFGLFFKDTQMVTVTAADNSGEAVTVEYLLSDKELTKAKLDGMTFTVYTAPFGIDPDNEYIIYVKLTDKAGNMDYICSDGIVLDGTSPVITGIEDGKTYCEAQTVTITEKYVDTVTVNGTEVTLDENGSFVLSPADGGQKIVVTDKAGNTAEMSVTVNDGHTFGEWTSNGDGTHTRQCTADGCTEGVETDNCIDEDKNHICDICGNIISKHEDANQDHVCDLCGKVISNHEDADNNHICDYCEKAISNHEDADKDHVCDYCGKTISNHEDADKDHVCDYCEKIISNHEDADKDHVCDHCGKVIFNHEDANKDHVCDYCEKVISNHEDADKDHICDLCGKTISNHADTKNNHVCDYCGKTISNHEDADKDHVCDLCGKVITNHAGGKETCRDKAVCEVCGKAYGELDPKNHTDLKHFPAKAATEDAEGNVEYWHCDDCNKYYSDKDGTKEIKKADTVTTKLPKSPPTGDTSNLMLWIALLFISGGAVIGTAVTEKKKKQK